MHTLHSECSDATLKGNGTLIIQSQATVLSSIAVSYSTDLAFTPPRGHVVRDAPSSVDYQEYVVVQPHDGERWGGIGCVTAERDRMVRECSGAGWRISERFTRRYCNYTTRREERKTKGEWTSQVHVHCF